MTQFDEKLLQIQSESFRERRLVRHRVGRLLLGGVYRIANLGGRRR